MITVQMDNSSDLSSRERAQRLFSKNIELENKRRRSAQARVPSDPNAWQQMRENYEAIILEDHAFSEQNEIEYALWQLHYRRIEELRAHFSTALGSTNSATSQGGKVSARTDRVTKIRLQFKTFLSEATGFYHDLMLKIRAKYGLPLGYFSDDSENQNIMSKDENRPAEIKKGLISCHRCLIYLGDLSRYKGLYGEGDSKARDFAAASSYYMQASSLWPASGNPHHQLAILASYLGDELLAIYRYFRSLAVDNPFSTARENLVIAFEKNRQSFSQLLEEAKALSKNTAPVQMTRKGRGKVGMTPSANDTKTDSRNVKVTASSTTDTFKLFSIRFVRLNGILFTRTSLETFGEVFSAVRSDFRELLSSGPEEAYNFGSGAADNALIIVRIVSILIFTVHNVNKESENQSYAEILQRSVLLQNAFTAIFDFMGLIVERCLQLHIFSASYLVPVVLVFMEWLACHPDMAAGSELEEKQASARLFFWNNCISFLNKLLSSGSIDEEDTDCFRNMSRYDEDETANRVALWEDFELRGFLPLVPAQVVLDFSRKQSFGSEVGTKEKKARFQRIIAAGKALVGVVQSGQGSMYYDPRLKKFAFGDEPQMYHDFPLSTSLEMPTSNGLTEDQAGEKLIQSGRLLAKAQSHLEEEEEDEVIVFKPLVPDKRADASIPKVSSESVGPVGNANLSVMGRSLGHVSTSLAPLRPNTFDISSNPVASVATCEPHLQSVHPITSNWLMESQVSIACGLNSMHLEESGLHMKPALHGNFGVHNATFSLPLVHAVNPSSGTEGAQLPDAMAPSKSDSVMVSGARFDALNAKSTSALPVNARMNPVSRPVRHLGPPPGFSHVPKLSDESLSGNILKKENNVQMDDYSWLDGYDQSLSVKKSVFNNSINGTAQLYHQGTKDTSLSGTVGFPFPGKQIPTLQTQMDNQKTWHGFQNLDRVKLYEDQLQQLHRMKQQSVPLPDQHQGQSRFLV